jgi:hypothetical protein
MAVLRNRPGIEVFRNNAGQMGPRHTRFGLSNKRFQTGSSDFIGWVQGRFLAIEVKAGGEPTEAQEKFLNQVNEDGGIGIVARSVEDVLFLTRRPVKWPR